MAKDKAGALSIEVGVDDSKVTKTLASVEREVRQSIKMFRDYDSALRNSDKTLKDFDKSMNANQKSMKMVEQSIAGVKTKMAELENKTDNLATATEKERAHYDRLQRSLAKMESDYNQLSKASGNLKRQLAYEKSGVNQAEDAYRKLKEQQEITFGLGTKGVIKAQKRIRGYRDEQKQLREVIKALRSNIDELSKEFGENSSEVLGAKRKLVDYQKELKNCNSNIKELRKTGGGTFSSLKEGASSIGQTMSIRVTAPIVAGLSAATVKATEFGDEMTTLKSVLDGTKKEVAESMETLKKASLSLSKEYGVSTQQINEGMVELAKNGNKTKEILSLTKIGILGSKAAGEDFNGVIQALSGTMKTFGVDAKNIKEVNKTMDQLVSVANSSSTGVLEIGDALAKFGVNAKQSGMDVAQAASAFGVLRDRNIDASTAATSLKSGLVNIAAAAKNVADGGELKASTLAFMDLGVNLKDVYQNGINLPNMLKTMTAKLSKMTDEQKKATIAAAFGKESMAAWGAFMDTKAIKSLENYTDKARKSNGSTQEMWKTMKDSPKQSVDEFKSSLSALGVTFGEKVLPKITPFIEKITDLLNKFGDADSSTQNFVLAMLGISAVIGPVSSMFSGLMGVVGGLASVLGLPATAVGILGAAFGIAYAKCEPFREVVNKIGKAIGETFSVLWDGIKGLPQTFSEGFGEAWDSFTTFTSQISEGIASDWAVIKESITDIPKNFKKGFSDAWNSLKETVSKASESFNQSWSDIKGCLTVIPGQFKESFGKAWGSFKDSMNSMKDKASKAWGKIKSSFKDGIDSAVNKVKNWTVVKGFRDKFNASMKETGSFSKSFKAGMRGAVDAVTDKVSKWTIVQKFKAKWDTVRLKTENFVHDLKDKIAGMVKKIADKVSNWSIVQKFKAKWDTVRLKTENFVHDLKDKIADMVKKIADCVRNSSIGKAFSSVFEKSWNVVAGVLQKISGGAAWVLEKLGADDVASKLRNWGDNLKKYSTGTGVGGHPGGLMMVNDAASSNYQELVVRPNGEAFIPQGRNVVMYGEPGTQVLRGDKTANLMNSLGIRPYAKGTGFINKAVDFGKGLVKKAKDVIGDVMDYMGHPGKLVSKVFSHFVGVPDGIKYGVDVAKGTITRAKDALKAKIKGLFDAMDTGDIDGTWGDLGSNNWFQIHGCWVREWQYRLLEPIIKKYGFQVTDGGRRTWDNFDHSKGKAMDIALPNNPLGLYWKVAQQIDKMPLVSYVNSNLKSSYGHKGLFTPSDFEPRADHIHVSFKKELLSQSELRGNKGRAGGSLGNPGGAGVARWRPYVIKALRANGLPTTPAYINAWMRQIQTESGGNPRAIGGNDGLNEGNATGLLQVKPGTFQANKHPGHGNIFNGYDNMLAAMRYAKRKYTVSGMLLAIGRGHGYENGGLVMQHQLAQIAEGNKPEMVIPLTDTSRSVQLIRQAQRFVGEKHFEEKDDKTYENEMLKRMLTKMQETNELLKALLLKDSDVYLDGNKVSAHMDARAKSEQTRRAIANGMI